MKLQGKTAIITGAAKGIGAATARLFASEGARLLLLDKDETNGAAVAASIAERGGKAVFRRCDVGCEADVRAALDTVVDVYGDLDIVVNNAGWQLNKSLLETTAEEFNAVLNTNLTSMFLFTKGAAELFIARKRGHRQRMLDLRGGGFARLRGLSRVQGRGGLVYTGRRRFADAAQHPRQRRRAGHDRHSRTA